MPLFELSLEKVSVDLKVLDDNFTWMFTDNDYLQTTKQQYDDYEMQVKKSDFLLSFQMGEVWNELQPKLGCLFGGGNGLKPPI